MQETTRAYFRFTGKSRFEKSINTLLGLLEGIALDGKVTSGEVAMLRMWLEDHQDVARKHPFSELVPVVESALSDGVLADDEREDLLWLCRRLTSREFFDMVTTDLQRLHAVVGGIAADGVITTGELRALSDWLSEHEHLKSCWPYDEIESLTTKVLSDGRLDDSEQKIMLHFFSEFLAVLDERTIVKPIVFDQEGQLVGALCAVNHDVTIRGSKFCFTGAASRHTRRELEEMVAMAGGEPQPGVTKKLNYLVIGAEGNPCWAFSCYGRKVEKAIELRRQGINVVLLHEMDFHDAMADVR